MLAPQALERKRGSTPVLLTRDMPHGFGKDVDQLRRACSSVVRNIAEGAARWSPADKASRFVIARGEAAEASAAVDLLLVVEVVERGPALELLEDLDRVGAMLTRLVQRHHGA